MVANLCGGAFHRHGPSWPEILSSLYKESEYLNMFFFVIEDSKCGNNIFKILKRHSLFIWYSRLHRPAQFLEVWNSALSGQVTNRLVFIHQKSKSSREKDGHRETTLRDKMAFERHEKPSFADRIAYVPKRGRLPLGGIVGSCVIAGLTLGFSWDIYTYYEFYKNPNVRFDVLKLSSWLVVRKFNQITTT